VPPVSDALLFWLIAAAMVALALGFVLPGLLGRRAPPEGARRVETNAAIYRSALADLARERAEGRLSDPQYARSREEIERRLLSDVPDERACHPTAGSPRAAAFVMAVAFPMIAFGLYRIVGDPVARDGASGAASATVANPGTVAVRRDELLRHLARNPRDGRGWALLARMDFEADRFSDAAAAYEKALATSPKIAADAGVWCEYADALGMAQGSALTGRPRELVMRALTLDPAHPKALEMAGSAAYEQREFAAAAQHWRQLLTQLSPTSVRHRELASAIAHAERLVVASDDGPGRIETSVGGSPGTARLRTAAESHATADAASAGASK
jgi:cytochrome c-type biogenesis protein CcmH